MSGTRRTRDEPRDPHGAGHDATGPHPLGIRAWTCAACGTRHDRDHNAAINVKTAAGPAVTACGAPVRPGAILAQREETGSHGFPTEPRAA
ncbi:zinc ribbon domain-containing protein [Streptomyces sp. NPDC088812]|uniref:zinc ribbon domain-containing protein n=1 Tax=Streptomyces sp. NPDC088812 TaxID=3365905 RepID=UPI0038228C53